MKGQDFSIVPLGRDDDTVREQAVNDLPKFRRPAGSQAESLLAGVSFQRLLAAHGAELFHNTRRRNVHNARRRHFWREGDDRERSSSGGDALPFYFKETNLGPLVGKRSWGGLVGIYGEPLLMDGARVTAPRVAFFNTRGEGAVENIGVAPDIEVDLDCGVARGS